eukprot:TRINITY_DN235_c0_g2_i3.p1 TRINITY_DN235_c0_g2~~TRINITY_DN235_c0_g2_i3.p1  ORF type:complete len:147 (+),score=25.31 TRINITY_DN235_c0_g2_i3:115-555(+)
MIRRPPRSTLSSSSAASDVYKRQPLYPLVFDVEVRPTFELPPEYTMGATGSVLVSEPTSELEADGWPVLERHIETDSTLTSESNAEPTITQAATVSVAPEAVPTDSPQFEAGARTSTPVTPPSQSPPRMGGTLAELVVDTCDHLGA